ncbi:MAG: dicarboxylate/amino acid:cation symporter [Nannocystaceae bacterium]|nr:dicarboxylate/amino acid:cation symporter [Nannocystaceae bacterium]
MVSLQELTPAPLHRLVGQVQDLLRSRLWLKVTVGLVLGIVAGFGLGPDLAWVSPSSSAMLVEWAAFPGQLFLSTIQMMVVPLVFASIVGGLAASENTDQLKALGLRAGIYFVFSSTVAITLGLAVSVVLAPGALLELAVDTPVEVAADTAGMPTITEIPQAVLGLMPTNPLGALVTGQMLQIVVFAFVIGIALVVMPKKRSAPLLDLLESLQAVCMTVVQWAMKLAPIAVFGLSVRLTATVGLDALVGMAAYVGTVFFGLALLMVFYLVLVTVLGRRSPWKFLAAVRDVQVLGFSTSSSAAVMPLSMKTAEEKLGVKPAMAQFVIPLGATINMDGTALYQGVATVFLAQAYGIELGIGGLVLIIATAVAASIGAPAAPGVGIVILSGILASAGIPASGVALLLGVDRLLDMARTSVNVTGDLVACVVLDRWLAPPTEAATPQVAD